MRPFDKKLLALLLVFWGALIYLNVIAENHKYLFWAFHDVLIIDSCFLGFFLYYVVIKPRREK